MIELSQSRARRVARTLRLATMVRMDVRRCLNAALAGAALAFVVAAAACGNGSGEPTPTATPAASATSATAVAGTPTPDTREPADACTLLTEEEVETSVKRPVASTDPGEKLVTAYGDGLS